MSYDMLDEMRDDALEDEYWADIAERAVEDFKDDRLAEQFRNDKTLPKPAFEMLKHAKKLQETSPSASLVFAYSSVEITLKNVLLKPLIRGLIHSDQVSWDLPELLIGQRSLRSLKRAIHLLVKKFGGIDLKTLASDTPATNSQPEPTLWKQIIRIGMRRNKVVHDGATASLEHAKHAIAVAESVLNEVLSPTLFRLGFEVDANGELAPYNETEF